MFMTDLTMGPVDARACGRGARAALAVRARAHAHPDQPAHAAADGRRRAARRVQAHARSVRRAGDGGGGVTERLVVGTGICLVAQREPIVTAKAVATLDQLLGRPVRARHRLRLERRRDRRPRRRRCRSGAPSRASTCSRCGALWANDVGVVRRRVRAASRRSWSWPKPVQRRRAAGADRRRRRARSCSRTSPSTPTAGSRSVARACARALADLAPRVRGGRP